MPDRWPVVITDDDGSWIRVEPDGSGPGKVCIRTAEPGVTLDAAQLEEFAQAKVAASHEADRQARPAPCGAVSPYARLFCGQYGDHTEHIAREPGGMIAVTWPVRDG